MKRLPFKRTGEFTLTLIFFLFFSLLLILSFSYRPSARLFPVLALIPTVVLLLIQILGHFFPRLQFWIEIFDTTIVSEKFTFKDDSKPKEIQAGKIDEIVSISSWLLYGVLAYLIGFKAASTLMVFILTLFYAKRSFVFTILLSLSVFLFLEIVFVRMLKVSLYTGVLNLF